MIAGRSARLALFSAVISTSLLSGCRSREDAAIDKAKKQAAATGQAQQVVYLDKNGNSVTTTVQPPTTGQAGQVVTTTVTPAASTAANTPAPAPGESYAAAPAAAGSATAVPSAGYADAGSASAVAGSAAAMPLAGGAPVVRPAQVDIAAGTSLMIRISQHISVKRTPAGTAFNGEVAEPVSDSGRIVVPQGTPVGGIVEASHRRGHFKGRSLLELRLTSMTLNGVRYPISTRDLVRSKKGKGKRSAAFIGGGAGLGMLIGGVASGGVGLLAGGLAGGGAGTAVAGLTGNRDVEIPAESIVRFRLNDDLVVQAP